MRQQRFCRAVSMWVTHWPTSGPDTPCSCRKSQTRHPVRGSPLTAASQLSAARRISRTFRHNSVLLLVRRTADNFHIPSGAAWDGNRRLQRRTGPFVPPCSPHPDGRPPAPVRNMDKAAFCPTSARLMRADHTHPHGCQTNPRRLLPDAGMPCSRSAATIAFTGGLLNQAAGPSATTGTSTGCWPLLSQYAHHRRLSRRSTVISTRPPACPTAIVNAG